MKSLLKFSLLSALIIGGKLAKQPVPVTVAQPVKFNAPSDSSVILVHQVYTAEPMKPGRERERAQQSGSGWLPEPF